MILSELSDQAVRRIDMSPLKRHFTTELNILVKMMEAYGFKLRIVGGAVRDVLLGREPRDIDLITDALPDAVMFILGKHKIPYKTKGIPHGTVIVNFPDEEYEITSLGYQIEDECCPPNLVVHSGESWKGDAERRDFTIDTMSLTFDGMLYDYLDGIQDLRNSFVRFIGSPAKRMQDDPILIMRFFKLLSLFREPKFDKSVLATIKEKMHLIKKIKPDRLAKEIGNVRRGPSADKVIKLMQNLGFASIIDELKEELLICEANLMSIVPAIRISTGEIFIGQRGQTHADVYEQIPETIWDRSGQPAGAPQLESGFYEKDERRFLTRSEALELVQAGESNHLAGLQRVHARKMAAA